MGFTFCPFPYMSLVRRTLKTQSGQPGSTHSFKDQSSSSFSKQCLLSAQRQGGSCPSQLPSQEERPQPCHPGSAEVGMLSVLTGPAGVGRAVSLQRVLPLKLTQRRIPSGVPEDGSWVTEFVDGSDYLGNCLSVCVAGAGGGAGLVGNGSTTTTSLLPCFPLLSTTLSGWIYWK